MSNLLLTAVSLHRLSVFGLNLSLYLIIVPGVTGTVVVTYKKVRRYRGRLSLAPSVYHRLAYLSIFFLAGAFAELGFFVGTALNYYLSGGK